MKKKVGTILFAGLIILFFWTLDKIKYHNIKEECTTVPVETSYERAPKGARYLKYVYYVDKKRYTGAHSLTKELPDTVDLIIYYRCDNPKVSILEVQGNISSEFAKEYNFKYHD